MQDPEILSRLLPTWNWDENINLVLSHRNQLGFDSVGVEFDSTVTCLNYKPCTDSSLLVHLNWSNNYDTSFLLPNVKTMIPHYSYQSVT